MWPVGKTFQACEDKPTKLVQHVAFAIPVEIVSLRRALVVPRVWLFGARTGRTCNRSGLHYWRYKLYEFIYFRCKSYDAMHFMLIGLAWNDAQIIQHDVTARFSQFCNIITKASHDLNLRIGNVILHVWSWRYFGWAGHWFWVTNWLPAAFLQNIWLRPPVTDYATESCSYINGGIWERTSIISRGVSYNITNRMLGVHTTRHRNDAEHTRKKTLETMPEAKRPATTRCTVPYPITTFVEWTIALKISLKFALCLHVLYSAN